MYSFTYEISAYFEDKYGGGDKHSDAGDEAFQKFRDDCYLNLDEDIGAWV